MKTPDWSDKAAVIVCAGPSLTDAQLDAVRRSNVHSIAVNTAFFYFPEAEVHYAGDFMLWKTYHARIRKACPRSQLWTQDGSAAERFQLNRQRGGNREGLGLNVVHMNGNSGFQAINLAFLWGCRRILLLGMDMKLGPNGEKHRHGDHEKPLVQAQLFEEWRHKGKKLAEDLAEHKCEVINCTLTSALECFPKLPISEALNCDS
jgi:hypothetical protein